MRALLNISLAAAVLLGSTVIAAADEVPVLNIRPVCKGIAEQGAEPSERGGPDLAFDQCIESEQSVRQELAKEWSTFAADDKTHCVREATMGGESSYTDLITCLEMARDVKELKSGGKITPSKTRQVN
jgi:hypothetical protein